MKAHIPAYKSSVLLIVVAIWFSAACTNSSQEETSRTEDCQVYQEHAHKLEAQLIEAERNADRLENMMYQLTQNYIVIDQKIRLMQRIKSDGSQERLMQRTASEINRFFVSSQQILDSVKLDIQKSSLPQSSMIPILETVEIYLGHQEKLFIEMYGSIQAISGQVSNLKKTVATQQTKLEEQKGKVSESERLVNEKDRLARQIFYLVGGKGELERAKAIQKKGGFLGLGKTIELSDRLEEMFFQQADYQVMKEISLGNTQHCNLITNHPKGTYLVLKTPGEWYLKITNPQKFWSTSKFLVVEVD